MKLSIHPMREMLNNKLIMTIELDYGNKPLPRNFWLTIWRLNQKSVRGFLLWVILQSFIGRRLMGTIGEDETDKSL